MCSSIDGRAAGNPGPVLLVHLLVSRSACAGVAGRRSPMLTLLLVGLLVFALLWLPFLLIKGALRLVLAVVTLPFKLVGLVFGLLGTVLGVVFGVLGGVFRVLASGLGLVAGILAFVLFVVLLPLLPVALVLGALWLISRRSRRPALRVA